MADPVTNIEFDEVLSSIRRLVSKEETQTSEPVEKENDRFVLTPAFRVDDVSLSPLGAAPAGDSEIQEPTPDDADHKNVESGRAVSEPLVLSDGFFSRRSPSEPVIAPESLESAPPTAEIVDETAVEVVSTSTPTAESKPAPQDAPTPPLTPSALLKGEGIEQSAQFQTMAAAWNEELVRMAADRGTERSETPETKAPGPRNSLELRIAELEDAVNKSEDDWEPDGIEPEIARPPRHHIFEIVDNTKSVSAEVANVESQSADDPFPAPQDAGEIEEPVIFNHAAPPPAAPFVLSNAAAIQPESKAPAPIVDPSQGDIADADNVAHLPHRGAGETGVVEDDDVFLDVDALRVMIADVVREELRGTMGERITLNLRRMVRQEIERALLPGDKG